MGLQPSIMLSSCLWCILLILLNPNLFLLSWGRYTNVYSWPAMPMTYITWPQLTFCIIRQVRQVRLDFQMLELEGPRQGRCVGDSLAVTRTTTTLASHAGSKVLQLAPPLCGNNTGQHGGSWWSWWILEWSEPLMMALVLIVVSGWYSGSWSCPQWL